MVLDWRIRLGLVVGGAVIVAVALAGAAWGALDQGLVRDALTLIGGLLAGLGVAGGRGRAAAVLLLTALPWVQACAGNPCIAERSTVAALGVAVELADRAIPQDTARRDEIIDASRSAIALGVDAVDGCEAVRDDDGWQAWVVIGVRAVKDLVDLIRAHGVEIPPDIVRILDDLVEIVDIDGPS